MCFREDSTPGGRQLHAKDTWVVLVTRARGLRNEEGGEWRYRDGFQREKGVTITTIVLIFTPQVHAPDEGFNNYRFQWRFQPANGDK